MAGEQLDQEQVDEVKTMIHILAEKIRTGDAPEQIMSLYQNLGPTNFGYWAHGFFCGYSSRKELRQTELFKFLKEVSEQN